MEASNPVDNICNSIDDITNMVKKETENIELGVGETIVDVYCIPTLDAYSIPAMQYMYLTERPAERLNTHVCECAIDEMILIASVLPDRSYTCDKCKGRITIERGKNLNKIKSTYLS